MSPISLEIATSDEARDVLLLNGADKDRKDPLARAPTF
jgi:hypothetical protein